MKKYSKIIAMLLVVSIMLPGIVQASPTSKDVPSIRRIAGPGRVETSVEASKIAFKNGGAKNVVLAGYSGEVDALAGTILANAKNAPLILTKPKVVSDVVKKELKRLGAKNIYILGGESVVSKAVFENLKKDYTVKRIAGSNREGTAAAVAKEVGGKTSHVFLAKGYDIIADALAAGPVSAIENMPILLTRTDRIADATLEAMKDLGVTHVTIVGGETAVSKVVENKLKKYKVDRIEGSNREKTAVAIAEKYFTNPTNSIIANGYVYADALVGGYLGAKMDAPILLTNVNKTSKDTIDYLGKNTETAYLLGGQNAVSLEVYSRIEKIIEVSVKETAKAELNNYVDDKDYAVNNAELLAKTIKDGKTKIDNAVNKEAVTEALNSAKLAIDKIKTDAQIEEELAQTKENLRNLLKGIEYVEVSIDGSDIQQENKWTVQSAKTALEEAVSDAKELLASKEFNFSVNKGEVLKLSIPLNILTNNGKWTVDDETILKINTQGISFTGTGQTLFVEALGLKQGYTNLNFLNSSGNVLDSPVIKVIDQSKPEFTQEELKTAINNLNEAIKVYEEAQRSGKKESKEEMIEKATEAVKKAEKSKV